MDQVDRLGSNVLLHLQWLIGAARDLPIDALLLGIAWTSVVSLVALVALTTTRRKNCALKHELENVRKDLSDVQKRYESEVKWRMAEKRYMASKTGAPVTAPRAAP